MRTALDGPVGGELNPEASEENGGSPPGNGQLTGQKLEAQPSRGSSTARYESAGPARLQTSALTGQPPAAEPSQAVRPLDSSQGTPRDPLKNKSYDLNYAKTVPAMPYRAGARIFIR
jgi:UPF0755 protein